MTKHRMTTAHSRPAQWRAGLVRCTVLAKLLTFALMLSWVPPGASQPQPKPSVGDTSATAKLVDGNTEFALNLYSKLRATPGNLFFSPYCVSSALAMTYGGARGNTAAQMADVLHFTLADQDLHKTFAAITNTLNERAKAGALELSVANALWGQEGEAFMDEFLDLNAKHYGASLEQVDFIHDTEGARETINTWVKQATRDRIRELMRQGILDPSTRLVLTNAIYFRGNWASEFNKERTTPRPFWVGPDTSVTVQMMHDLAEFNYVERETFKGVELPYADSSLSMLVFIPKRSDGLPVLEHSLNQHSLDTWLSLMRGRMIIMGLPKFEVSTDFRLDAILQSMGMTEAFNAKLADFSGMTGKKELFIDAVLHKASLEVNEAGTEAAAGTAVVMEKMHPVVRADRPFLFMIRDNDSGSILFMGRVTDPTQ